MISLQTGKFNSDQTLVLFIPIISRCKTRKSLYLTVIVPDLSGKSKVLIIYFLGNKKDIIKDIIKIKVLPA